MNAKTTYTPGPWTFGYGGGLGQGNIYSEKFPRNGLDGREALAVCHIPGLYQRGKRGDEHSPAAFEMLEANARLMAAAPAMLAALRMFLAWDDNGHGTAPAAQHDAAMKAAKAAVKLATEIVE